MEIVTGEAAGCGTLEIPEAAWPYLDRAGSGPRASETILVHGERDAFERTLSDNPYPSAAFRRAFPKLSEMQLAAREFYRSRRSFALRAPTSSGKTLSFAAPIFESGHPAIFVYPYRALLLDQAWELSRMASFFGWDGDDFGVLQGGVGRNELAQQLEGKRFLLATPDKLVSLFLGGRESTMAAMSVLSATDFVFDEIHAYGALGTKSLIYFLRSVRLWQDAVRASGGTPPKPVFVFSSATLPADLWTELRDGLGMNESDQLTGPSNTGDATVEILAARGARSLPHPIATDMAERGAVSDSIVIVNSPFAAYQIVRSPEVNGHALLFVGQDKMAERQRRANLRTFLSETSHYALVGSSAIEAGVDAGAHWSFVEATQGPSFLQRLGRVARAGRDARMVLYANYLRQVQGNGLLKAEYERADFTRLVGLLHPAAEGRQVMTALAAGPYARFWGKRATEVVDADDLDFLRMVGQRGAPALLAFRGLTPYTAYESGERISYSSLFRKELRMDDGGKVVGSPSVERYFNAPERRPVTVSVERIAHHEQVERIDDGVPSTTHWMLAEANFGGAFGRHWTVLEVGAHAAPPDNIILRRGTVALSGPGTGNVARFATS